MDGLARSLALPGRALRLLVRFAPAMLVWYCAGFIVHDVLIQRAGVFSDTNDVLALAVVAVAILARLAATIGMLHAVRTGLPAVRRLSQKVAEPGTEAGGVLRAVADEESRLADVVSFVILPFVVFYGAWNLFAEDMVEVVDIDLSRNSGLPGFSSLLDIEVPVLLVVSISAWVLRAACERPFRRRNSRVFGILAALFEAIWMLFGFLVISRVLGAITDWATTRVAWVEARDSFHDVLDGLPGVLGELWDGWTDYLGLVSIKFELMTPILWLVIAALVFGRDMERERDLVEGTAIDAQLDRRLETVPTRARRVVATVSGEAREKYVPFLNGLRLAVRTGLLWYLALCVLWAGVGLAHQWSTIGIAHLIGPRDPAWGAVLDEPITFAVEALFGTFGVVRMALLAVAVDDVFAVASRRSATAPELTASVATAASVGVESQVAR